MDSVGRGGTVTGKVPSLLSTYKSFRGTIKTDKSSPPWVAFSPVTFNSEATAGLSRLVQKPSIFWDLQFASFYNEQWREISRSTGLYKTAMAPELKGSLWLCGFLKI
eukprot:TRINITY_DN4635_c0_g1_i7.p1 TRINITY_DN4635_c0_g1~~TRINITY_DN4635_c0_g1_i7.p1  ORF type:complete len:107 (-),score=20.02 TRINITY_DN4635_c0_g1_i7:57-377(-)